MRFEPELHPSEWLWRFGWLQLWIVVQLAMWLIGALIVSQRFRVAVAVQDNKGGETESY